MLPSKVPYTAKHNGRHHVLGCDPTFSNRVDELFESETELLYALNDPHAVPGLLPYLLGGREEDAGSDSRQAYNITGFLSSQATLSFGWLAAS